MQSNFKNKNITYDFSNQKIKAIFKEVITVTQTETSFIKTISEIEPDENKKIDSISKNDTRFIKYIIVIEDNIDKKYQTFNIDIVNKDTTCSYNIFGVLGDQISKEINVIINDDMIEFYIKNNSVNQLKVIALKVKAKF